jgi:hypothetical protein
MDGEVGKITGDVEQIGASDTGGERIQFRKDDPKSDGVTGSKTVGSAEANSKPGGGH